MTSLTCKSTYTGGIGCQIYDTAVSIENCIKCRDGFRPVGVVCAACLTNCILCDTNNAAERCLTALPGYYINSLFAVIKCPTNCLWCIADGNTVKCTGTIANYFVLSTATNMATACSAGTSKLESVFGVT
jgi:hypothetical protein